MEIKKMGTGASAQTGTSAGTQNFSGSSPAKVAGEIDGLRLLAYCDTDELSKMTMPDKKYKKFLSDFKYKQGYFNFYFREDNKTLLEIRPEQLDSVFLLSSYRVTALPKELRLPKIHDVGYDSDSIKDNYVVYFKKIGARIHFFAKNLDARSNDKSYAKAIEKSGNDIFLGSTDIKAINKDSGNMVIELDKLMVKDADNLLYTLSLIDRMLPADKQPTNILALTTLDLEIDKNNSYVSEPKTFPANSEIPATVTYSPKKAADSSFQITYNFSFSALPKNSYIPREAVPEIGYFKTSFKNFNKDKLITDDRMTHLINRWHIEKLNPNAKISPPKEPLVFWIAKDVPKEPKEIREGLRQGALLWNEAFEKIGIKDAIVVKDQPDNADWEAGDIKHNTISLFNGASHYAMGGSQVNPLTGEIYAAGIILDFESINNDVQEMLLLDENLEKITDEKQRENYINRAIINIITSWMGHEVGHTLGLRHNFAGSTYQKNGVTASMMDYLPAHFPIDNKTIYNQQVKCGDYDFIAIKSGYGSEEDSKEAVRERIKQNIPYATDEQQALDPYCNQYDNGNPLDYCKELLNHAQKIWSKIETKFEKPGTNYETLSKIFNNGIDKYYSNSVNLACKYLGGTHYNNLKVGDILGKTDQEPVSSEDQRAALKFLAEEIFSPNVFSFSPKLLSKLAPLSPADISAKQTKTLDTIFDNKRLLRVETTEKKYAEKPFKTSEIFKIITEGIFSEAFNTETKEINMNFYRMELQKAYIKKLQEISGPISDFSKDAKKSAESSLAKIKSEVSYALQRLKHKQLKMDAEVEEHFNTLFEK